MKKLLTISLIPIVLLCAIFVSATVTTWHPTDSVKVAWDEALLIDGSSVPPEDSITYFIYSKNEDGSDQKLLGNTDLLEYTVTVPVDAKILVGVSAQRIMADGTQTEESAINWSDVAEGNQGDTFGLSNIRSSAAPGSIQGITIN